MTTADYKQVPLQYFPLPRSNDKIPAIGYGSGTKNQWTKKSRDESIRDTLHEGLAADFLNALKHGFRHIDTAEIYTTHDEVGHALNAALKESGLKREDFFITDKFHVGFESKQLGLTSSVNTSGPYESIEIALKKLGTDYIDLYLIHSQFFRDHLTRGLTIEEAWKQIEKAHAEGKIKNIGLSNFDKEHIEGIYKIATVKPQVLQIEFHPYLQNQSEGIIQFAKDNDILVEAYSPLAPLFRSPDGPLKDVLPGLIEKYGRTEAQILLRWVYQQGVLPLTTTSNEKRLDESLEIFNFELEQQDWEKIRDVGNTYKFRAFFQGFDGKDD